MRWVADAVSLERPVGKERDIELQDLLEDENVERPEDVTDSRLLSEALRQLMGNLTVREVQILRLRYGLGGSQTYTLSEIGKKFNLSRERIRQIEREALAKMRLVAPSHRLEHYL
jgi:RNA polymerase primary sigma factor